MIGEVTKPQGVRGELRVYPLTDNVERFLKVQEVILASPQGWERRRVERTRVDKSFAYLTLTGITSRDEAEKYRGCAVHLDRSAVPALEGRWYYFELEGMQVFEGEILLGTLMRVLETGANDVYLVEGPYGEVCIPALKTVVRRVDVPRKRMEVTLPPGLLDETDRLDEAGKLDEVDKADAEEEV